MAIASPTGDGRTPSPYLNRNFVESQYASNLIALDEQLAHHLAAGQALARILQHARTALSRDATSPELYRAVSEGIRLFDADLGVWPGEDAAAEVSYMVDILRGAVVVDPDTNDFVDAVMPYSSEEARRARYAAILRGLDRDE